MVSSNLLGGAAKRNVYAASEASAKAYVGRLPPGARGVEFFTDVAPRSGSAPHLAEWFLENGAIPGAIGAEEAVFVKILISAARHGGGG